MPSAGSTNVNTGIDTKELRAFRANLRRLKPDSPEWARAFAQINKKAGDTIATDAAGRLAARGRRGARAGGNIKGSASARDVRLRVSNTGGVPYTLAEVWGTGSEAEGRHTGWYAKGRYRESAGAQHPPWVGSSWEVGGGGEGPGGGPYGLNPAIHDNKDQVMQDWADAVRDLMAQVSAHT